MRTRYGASFSISAVARDLGMSKGYVSLVLSGHRPAGRLLRALGAQRRAPGIRLRLTVDDARQVASGVVPVALRARVASAVAAKECGHADAA